MDEINGSIEGLERLLERIKQRCEQVPAPGEEPKECERELESALRDLHAAREEVSKNIEDLGIARLASEIERQRYQELFDLAPVCYLATDESGMITSANDAAEDLLGAPREELLGAALGDFVPESDRAEFDSRMARLLDWRGVEQWDMRLQPGTGAQPIEVAVTVSATGRESDEPADLRWIVTTGSNE